MRLYLLINLSLLAAFIIFFGTHFLNQRSRRASLDARQLRALAFTLLFTALTAPFVISVSPKPNLPQIILDMPHPLPEGGDQIKQRLTNLIIKEKSKAPIIKI